MLALYLKKSHYKKKIVKKEAKAEKNNKEISNIDPIIFENVGLSRKCKNFIYKFCKETLRKINSKYCFYKKDRSIIPVA
jgi:hypothetical protein